MQSTRDMEQSEAQKQGASCLSWLPQISDIDRAFGTTKGMPEFEPAMEAYRDDQGGYGRFAENLMFKGLDAMYCIAAEGPEPEVLSPWDHQRLYDWLSASLESRQLKHEHKIGGIGLRLRESLVGIAYLMPGDTEWRIAGDVDRDEFPSVAEIREHLAKPAAEAYHDA